MMTATSILLYTRNRNMNYGALISTFVLRRQQAKKASFDRFNKLGVCMSYSSVLKKLTELGRNFDQEDKERMKSMEIECANFQHDVTEKLISETEIQIIGPLEKPNELLDDLCSKVAKMSLYR